MTTRYVDDVYTFYALTTRFDTGNGTDADSAPSYRIYEEETATPLLTGTMALLDSSNTAGFYSEQVTLSAANGFDVGKCYAVYIAGTVNSVAGTGLREFVVRKKPLTPTTEGRELDVSAGGEAGVDWANVGSPTTTVGLSGTTVKTATDVETDTQDIQTKIGTPAGASVSADIAAIEAQTDDIGAAGAGLTAVPWNAAWDAEVQSEVQDALDAALTEGYPTDGSTGSIAQLLYLILAHLQEKSVSGTTVTLKKLDGSTTAATLTLNDATSPTSVTRSG